MKEQIKYITLGIVLCTLAGCIAPSISLAYIPPIPISSVITDYEILDLWPGYPSGFWVSGDESSTHTNNEVYLKILSRERWWDGKFQEWRCELLFEFNNGPYNLLIFDWKVSGSVDNVWLTWASIKIHYTSGAPTFHYLKEGYRSYSVDSSRTAAYLTFSYTSYWPYGEVNQYFDYIKLLGTLYP